MTRIDLLVIAGLVLLTAYVVKGNALIHEARHGMLDAITKAKRTSQQTMRDTRGAQGARDTGGYS